MLTVLMLRGPQTPGELKQRAARIHAFADLAAVHGALEDLIGRELARQLPRRPGQKEVRYEQLLGADLLEADGPDVASPAPSVAGGPSPSPAAGEGEPLRDEVASLRAEVEALAERVARLEQQP